MDARIEKNKYLIIALVAVLVSTAYWSAYAANAFSTYHQYADVGETAYDMYYHVNFHSAVHGLQYIVFENHIAPDQLFILPFFALDQSPLTLLVLQAVLVSLAGLALFFIARDLLKSEKIGLIMCLAFLINPGVQGVLVFDYHIEMLIPIFFLLTFYFLVKRRKFAYVISLLLLLGTIEEAPFIGIAFGAAMALYGILREKDQEVRRSWLIYSAVAIVLSIVAFGFYSGVGGYLTHAYATGKYVTLPQIIRLRFIPNQLGTIGAPLSEAGAAISQYLAMPTYFVFALLIVFLSFGIAGLFDPLFALLFVSPWLFETFIVGNSGFVFIWNQYFAYAIAGTAVAAILALRNLKDSGETKNLLSFFKHKQKVNRYLVASVVACALVLFLLFPHFVYSKNINNLQQDLLFQVSAGERQQIQQLNSMVALIPKNATLMAPFFAMPQLYARQYFELISSSPNESRVISHNSTVAQPEDAMWFQPDYVLADFNTYISLNAGSGYQIPNFLNITGATVANGVASFNGIYAIDAYNGTAILLKKR